MSELFPSWLWSCTAFTTPVNYDLLCKVCIKLVFFGSKIFYKRQHACDRTWLPIQTMPFVWRYWHQNAFEQLHVVQIVALLAKAQTQIRVYLFRLQAAELCILCLHMLYMCFKQLKSKHKCMIYQMLTVVWVTVMPSQISEIDKAQKQAVLWSSTPGSCHAAWWHRFAYCMQKLSTHLPQTCLNLQDPVLISTWPHAQYQDQYDGQSLQWWAAARNWTEIALKVLTVCSFCLSVFSFGQARQGLTAIACEQHAMHTWRKCQPALLLIGCQLRIMLSRPSLMTDQSIDLASTSRSQLLCAQKLQPDLSSERLNLGLAPDGQVSHLQQHFMCCTAEMNAFPAADIWPSLLALWLRPEPDLIA